MESTLRDIFGDPVVGIIEFVRVLDLRNSFYCYYKTEGYRKEWHIVWSRVYKNGYKHNQITDVIYEMQESMRTHN